MYDLIRLLNSDYCYLSECEYNSIYNMIENQVVKTSKELREVITAYTSPQ